MAFTSLSMVGKIYVRVVCDRLSLLIGAVLMDEQQGGFRVLMALRQVSDSEGSQSGLSPSPWLFTIFINRIGSEARKKVYGSVQLTTGDIEVCMRMASYTVLMAELEEALYVIRKS